MKKFTLRNYIAEAKERYTDLFGTISQYWRDEGLPYAIMDYHSSVGSILDFTSDDIAVCIENGWTLDEVIDLCSDETANSHYENLKNKWKIT